MKRRSVLLMGFLFGLLCLGAAARDRSLDGVHRWLIWLDSSHPDVASLKRFRKTHAQMVIVDPDEHPPFDHLGYDCRRIAYLSIGEAETYRSYWNAISTAPFLVEANKDWEGNVRVDFRNPQWQSLLLEREIPRIRAAGFHGLMLDTVDVIPYLEKQDPVRFQGMGVALTTWLAAVRERFPEMVLLANGTEGLVLAAPYVDGYVTEGLFATYDFERKEYRKTTPEERQWRMAQVGAALKAAPHPVFAIEYTSPDHKSLGRWAARRSRRRGFVPFVSTKDLDRLLG